MSKVGRNELCPCGSGKKYKRCCRAKDEERDRTRRAEEQRGALVGMREVVERMAEGIRESDLLGDRVLELVEAGQLEEAEATARELEAEFPDETLFVERLAQVYEAKGQSQAAADEYRRGVAMMDAQGDGNFCDCCRARMVKAVWRLDPDGPALVLGRDPQ